MAPAGESPVARVLALQRAAGNRATTRLLARNNDRSGGAGRGTAVGDTEPSRDFRTDPAYVDDITDHASYDIATNRFQVRHRSGRWVDLDYGQIIQDMAASERTHLPGTVTLQVPPVYRDERSGLLFPTYFNERTAPNIVHAVRGIEALRPERQRQMRDALIEVAVASHGAAGGAISGAAQAAVRTRAGQASSSERSAGAQAPRFRRVTEAIASATRKVARRIDVYRQRIRAAMREGDTQGAERLVEQARAEAGRIRAGTSTPLEAEMPQLSPARREDLARQLEGAARETMQRTGVRVEVLPSPPGQTGTRGYVGGVDRGPAPVTPRSYGGVRRR